MNKFQVAYIPVGVPTFHLESAQKEFEKSIKVLKSLEENIAFPKEMLLSLDKLSSFLDSINPDLIVIQNITFANAAYTSEILKRFSSPILLWTLREPVIDGGRLRLNSLTGAFSAANTIKQFRKEKFEYVFGSPEEDKVVSKIKATISAAKLKKEMQSAKLVAVGHTPQGFGFGRALDAQMLKTFGVTLESIEARELIDKTKSFSEDEAKSYLEDAYKKMKGLEKIPYKNQIDFARLYKAYKEFAVSQNVKAIASRCWPDFFTAFGTPVCAVLALLNDLGVAASCEADTYGSLSMYICMELTKKPTFFGDPVSLNEKESTITFWHCGTAACSLARDDFGAKVGVHCNRKIGPTLDFGCKSAKEVTIFRVGIDSQGNFRFLIAGGEALDKPKQFEGTSVVVKTKSSAQKIITQSVLDGWEPHFVVAYANIENELEILANMLNIPNIKY